MVAFAKLDLRYFLDLEMQWRRIQSLLLSCIALTGLTGCAVSKVLVPYGVETGHTLSAMDYAHLQKIADALPGKVVFYRTKDPLPPIQTIPLVGYAYAFRSHVDVSNLGEIIIAPFAGEPGDPAKTAEDLPRKLAKRLASDGFPARVGNPDTPDACVVSGTVTRANTIGHAIDAATQTQVETILKRNGAVLGVMQVNAFVPASVSISPVVQLLSLALQDSQAEAISMRISQVLQRAKSGQPEAATGNSGLDMSAPAGTGYRPAPIS